MAFGAGAERQGLAQGMALVGCGSVLPAVSVSNERLSERVETSDDWIRSRTGIGARRVAGPDETLTSLAAERPAGPWSTPAGKRKAWI